MSWRSRFLRVVQLTSNTISNNLNFLSFEELLVVNKFNYKECPSQDDFRDVQCMHAAKQAASLNTLKLIGFEDVKTNLWKAFYSNGKVSFFSLFFDRVEWEAIHF